MYNNQSEYIRILIKQRAWQELYKFDLTRIDPNVYKSP